MNAPSVRFGCPPRGGSLAPTTRVAVGLALLLIPVAGVLAQEGLARASLPLELATGEPVALPSTASGSAATAAAGDACDRYAAPFFRGSGGFVVEPKDGRSADVTVQQGGASDTRTVVAGRDGLVVDLLASPLCTGPNGVSPAECQVSFSGIWGGGWYWVNGDRNAAVAPLVCSEDLGGGEAPLDPGGVQTLPSSFGTGTLFVHDTQGLMGIVPRLSPTGSGATPSCERYVAPFFRGRGGFVARPEAGQTAEVMIERGSSIERAPLSPRSDGFAVELLSDSLCSDADGEPVECRVSFTGIGAGGWYWVNGDRNAAVAPLVCEESLNGTPALQPGGVETSRAAFGTGTLFVHETQRLMGIVPHVFGAIDDERQVEVRVSLFGGGTVDVVGDGELACAETGQCSGYFPASGALTLTGAASPGYALDNWGGCDELVGADCVVALHSNRLVFASFASTQPARLSDRVVEFDERRLDDILRYDPQSGVLVLAADARVDDIGIHSILLSSIIDPERDFDSYFLRRVTDLKQSAGSPAYLKTAQATLVDLFAEGSLAARASLGAEAVSSYILPPGIVPASHPASEMTVRELPDGRRAFELSRREQPLEAVAMPVLNVLEGDLEYEDTIPIELKFELDDRVDGETVAKVTGKFAFHLTVEYLLDFDATGSRWRPWERELGEAEAKASLTSTVTVDKLVVEPGASGQFFNKSLDGLEIKLGTLSLGGVPVFLSLTGSVYLAPELTARVEPDMSLRANLTAGLKYKKGQGGWKTIWHPSFESSLGFPPGGLNAEAHLRAGVSVDLHAKVLNMAGPILYVGPYLDATAKLYSPPRGACWWDYDAEVGGEVRIGGTLELLDHTLFEIKPPWTIWNKPLWQGGRDCPDEAPPSPAPPDGLRFPHKTANSITVAWERPLEGGRVSYEVRYEREGNLRPFRKYTAPAVPRFTDRDALPDTRYCYQVRTVVGRAKSVWSRRQCERTLPLDVAPPSAPGGIVAEARSSSAISLSWDRSVDNRGVSHYVIVQAAEGTASDDAFAIASTGGNSYVVTGLNQETDYCFGARAVDRAGNASDVVEMACTSTFASDQARWRFRIACTGQAYVVRGFVDLDEDFVTDVSILGEAEDYDGGKLTYALTGPYDSATQILDGRIDWNVDGSAAIRTDRFQADLSLDDTGDIPTSKSGSRAECDAVIRFDRRDGATSDAGPTWARPPSGGGARVALVGRF